MSHHNNPDQYVVVLFEEDNDESRYQGDSFFMCDNSTIINYHNNLKSSNLMSELLSTDMYKEDLEMFGGVNDFLEQMGLENIKVGGWIIDRDSYQKIVDSPEHPGNDSALYQMMSTTKSTIEQFSVDQFEPTEQEC